MVAFALVAPVLCSRAALDGFHPAFGSMQFQRLACGFRRDESRTRRRPLIVVIELLPRRRLPIQFVFLFQ
jgi:hypothetical protein